jgi:DNA-nicking Smr family endonuclease
MELWERVAETVEPLRPRRRMARPAKPEAEAKPAPKAPVAGVPASVKPKAAPPKPPPLHPIDRRTMSRVNRGATEIDARIDLHGMTQAAAHGRLVAFLHEAQASGARMVLVITGKGLAGDSERGVLRRSVPGWLAAPDLRPLIIGFDEAGRPHGGAGALLVRLRRRR